MVNYALYVLTQQTACTKLVQYAMDLAVDYVHSVLPRMNHIQPYATHLHLGHLTAIGKCT